MKSLDLNKFLGPDNIPAVLIVKWSSGLVFLSLLYRPSSFTLQKALYQTFERPLFVLPYTKKDSKTIGRKLQAGLEATSVCLNP